MQVQYYDGDECHDFLSDTTTSGEEEWRAKFISGGGGGALGEYIPPHTKCVRFIVVVSYYHRTMTLLCDRCMKCEHVFDEQECSIAKCSQCNW